MPRQFVILLCLGWHRIWLLWLHWNQKKLGIRCEKLEWYAGKSRYKRFGSYLEGKNAHFVNSVQFASAVEIQDCVERTRMSRVLRGHIYQSRFKYIHSFIVKVIRKFLLKHNKSFRWHFGDYVKHNFFPFEGLWEELLSILWVFTDV